MRESRSSGSVEGVMSNRDPYSDCVLDQNSRISVGFGIDGSVPGLSIGPTEKLGKCG